MSSARTLLRNTGYLMLGEATKPVLSFLMILVVARTLGAEGMGSYTIILTVTALLETVAVAGLCPVMVRGIAAERSQLSAYISGGVAAAGLGSVVLAPLMLLLLPSFHYPADVTHGIQLLTVLVILAILQQQLLAVCEGLQMMRLRAAIALSDTAGRTAISVLMIVAGYGVLGLIYALVVVRALTTAGGFILLRTHAGLRFNSRVALPQAAQMLRAGIPFLMITLLSQGFWSINTLLLSTMRPVDDVGVFNAALRLPDILRTVFYSYMIAVLPVMSQSFTVSLDSLKQHCNASIKYMALITIPISTGLTLLAPRFLRLVFGNEFDAAIPVLQILSWTVCTFSIALVFARVLVASRNEIFDMWCNIAALAVNGVLGWVLIQRYGVIGAGMASVGAVVAFGIFEGASVARRLFVPDVIGPVARASAASAMMALALQPLERLPLLVLPLIGGVIYLAVLVFLGTFSREDIEMTRRLATSTLNALPLFARRRVAVETEP